MDAVYSVLGNYWTI